jgi:hypothetical protein
MGGGRGVAGAVSELVCIAAYGGFSLVGVVTFIVGVMYYFSIATATPRERARARMPQAPPSQSCSAAWLSLSLCVCLCVCACLCLSLCVSLYTSSCGGSSLCCFMHPRPAPDPTHPRTRAQCWLFSW